MKWRWILGFLLLSFFVADTVLILATGKPHLWKFDVYLAPGQEFWDNRAYQDLVWTIPALIAGVILLRLPVGLRRERSGAHTNRG